MFRNKVGGEEEERRHSLFDVEFIQKLLFTARTEISIQLFISGSLDSLNQWKKRDLAGALIPPCMATALPQIPSEKTGHMFPTASLQMQDGQFSSGIFIPGFQSRCTEEICLQPLWCLQQPPYVALLLPTSPRNLHTENVTSSWCYKLSSYYFKMAGPVYEIHLGVFCIFSVLVNLKSPPSSLWYLLPLHVF